MKTHPSTISYRARRWRLLPVMAAVLPLSISLLRADTPATPGSVSARPYKLFMGVNLIVEWHGKLWPVRGVERYAFVIEPDGKPVRVRDTDLRMKIDTVLKMTTAYAAITNVEAKRAYTPANDPRHYVNDSMFLNGAASDELDTATRNLNHLESVVGRSAAEGGRSTVTAQQMEAANNAFQQSMWNQGAEMQSIGDAEFREQRALSLKLYDAFSLSFKVAAAKPLENPYLVVMVRFRDKSDHPKRTRLLIYAQLLPSIYQRPQTVRLFRGGFPRGYKLVDYQIHLYEHGVEIATSAAPKEMAMTADEAFQYSIVNYVVRNPDKTLPPAPAWAFWPRKILAALPLRERNLLLFVKVSKDGSATGFYSDKACTRPIQDAHLEAVRPELRFDPALGKGKPVEGVAALNLGRGPD